MAQVYSKAIQQTIEVDRIIGEIKGNESGPTLVFFAGIHGNETAGVFALHQIINKIQSKNTKGHVFAIAGNLIALETNQRYLEKDLNRIWTHENLQNLLDKTNASYEDKEQLELYTILKTITNKGKPPFYFIDLHTTSSATLPFITIDDTLINRRFSNLFPVPIVLGIEEYLRGPLLSYINQLGFVSLGFESGQHDEHDAIRNAKAFVYLVLVFTGILNKTNHKHFKTYYNQLKKASKQTQHFFEVVELYRIKAKEQFKMINGLKSFQKIKKGTPLAVSNKDVIKSQQRAHLFMPLYQEKGDEGFFIIKKIHPLFLRLSVALRGFKADNLLAFLPGVSWQDKSKTALIINLRTAKFLAKPIFHLLGYRSRSLNKKQIVLFNRERIIKTKMYVNQRWYKKSLKD